MDVKGRERSARNLERFADDTQSEREEEDVYQQYID